MRRISSKVISQQTYSKSIFLGQSDPKLLQNAFFEAKARWWKVQTLKKIKYLSSLHFLPIWIFLISFDNWLLKLGYLYQKAIPKKTVKAWKSMSLKLLYNVFWVPPLRKFQGELKIKECWRFCHFEKFNTNQILIEIQFDPQVFVFRFNLNIIGSLNFIKQWLLVFRFWTTIYKPRAIYLDLWLLKNFNLMWYQ